MEFFVIEQRVGKLASLLNSAITSSDREEASRLLRVSFLHLESECSCVSVCHREA